MGKPDPDPIHPDARYCTATEAIKSPRWPFGRDTFYKRVRPNLTPVRLHDRANPIYSIAEIEAIFAPAK